MPHRIFSTCLFILHMEFEDEALDPGRPAVLIRVLRGVAESDPDLLELALN